MLSWRPLLSERMLCLCCEDISKRSRFDLKLSIINLICLHFRIRFNLKENWKQDILLFQNKVFSATVLGLKREKKSTILT